MKVGSEGGSQSISYPGILATCSVGSDSLGVVEKAAFFPGVYIRPSLQASVWPYKSIGCVCGNRPGSRSGQRSHKVFTWY